MFDLKGFRKAFNLTQKEIAEILGCGQANISGIEKNNRDLEESQKEKLIERFGEDSVIKFYFQSDSFEKEGIKESFDKHITYLLPMSSMGGALTGFSLNGVSLLNCEAIVSPIEDVDFAITVLGDSMYPEYPSGSRILIKKIDPNIFIEWGKTYVLDTPNGVIIKEIHECKGKDGFIKCHSINPDPKYSDFDVPINQIYGIYRVLMCIVAK